MRYTYNFNAGPAALPLEVIRQVQNDLIDINGIDLSILEISHRSEEYELIHYETQQLIRDLLDIPSDYEVLFFQGGASTQFAMVPMNFLTREYMASYVYSGTWSGKAIKEAEKIGEVAIVASSENEQFKRLPDLDEMNIHPGSAYVHVTSNETAAGVQYQNLPNTGNIPLICDMSSDILSRPFDVSKFGLIYAGAQKNLGPAGVTVVIVHRVLLDRIQGNIPDMMNYRIHAKSNSLYNTPPVFSVYVVNLVLKWIANNGGTRGMAERNRLKADLVYETIDRSGGFYKGLAHRDSRSIMNVTFSLLNEELERCLLHELRLNGFIGLEGHRDVGHLRASIYNSVTYNQCKVLTDFLTEFQRRYG